MTPRKVSRHQFSLAKVFVLTTVLALTLGIVRYGLPFQGDFLSFLALLMGSLFGIVFLTTDTSKLYWAITLAAWGMFLVSLLLPAVVVDVGIFQPNAQLQLGLGCAIVYYPFWISNILMILAPLLSYLQSRFLSRLSWIRVAIGILFEGSFFFATILYFSEGILSVHTGYFLWCVSFLLMSIAFFIKPAHFRTAAGAGIMVPQGGPTNGRTHEAKTDG